MSFTYLPGARPDALAILRDKGLLDTPQRPDPKPGMHMLDLHSHVRIGEDGHARKVPSKVMPYPLADAPVRIGLGPLIAGLPLGLVFLAIGWFALGVSR